jgi:hypothetical protein
MQDVEPRSWHKCEVQRALNLSAFGEDRKQQRDCRNETPVPAASEIV